MRLLSTFSLVGLAVVATAGSGRAESIAPGVSYAAYSLTGPVKVHVVSVNRWRPEYRLQIGWPQGQRNFTRRDTTSVIARLYDDAPARDVVAAINGSLFETTASRIYGVAASDGEILEMPNGRCETFFFGPSRVPVICENVGSVRGTLTFADGSSTTLHQYNRATAANTITAYTPNWAPTTGTTTEGVEVILVDVSYPMRGNKEIAGVVTAIRRDAASMNNTIPDGGMVLHACGTARDVVLARAAVGDRLRMRFATTAPDFNNADMAVTGAGWVVRNGMANIENWARYSSSYVDSRHPRTVLAWNAAQLFLIAVDGRSASSIGMTFLELTEFLTGTLGAVEALALDSGNSTTLVAGGSLRNRPCDGVERPVANAVLLLREDSPPQLPFFDAFGRDGRQFGWIDKFRFNDVREFSPPTLDGDDHVIEVGDPVAGGVETIRRGDFADADYSVEADVYCEYRPEVAADGFERYGIFARDDGTGAFGLTNELGRGNCYALTYDSDTGRVRAGVFVNGVMHDYREADPLYAEGSAWRRFRMDCRGTTISYYLDGEELVSASDPRRPSGCFGIAYQEYFRTNANIHGTRADNFAAVRLGPPPGHTPYLDVPLPVPGVIQAEQYDIGGDRVTWYDKTPGNAGERLRADDVDIEPCEDRGSGYCVGSIEAGEWLEYSVHVAARGSYDIRLRVSPGPAGAAFRIEMNGRDVTGTQEFNVAGDADEWTTVTVTGVALEEGNWQVLRLVAESGGWRLNSIEIVEAVPPPERAADPTPAPEATGVSLSAGLSWTAGRGAVSHNVYFGETSPGAFRGSQVASTFDPGPLAPGTTYYWRVDGVNESGVTTGETWSFTTEGRRTVQADFDGDGDVDHRDFVRFRRCFNGPNRPPDGDDCDASDFDGDGDVDDIDFDRFQACFNGANRPPACR